MREYFNPGWMEYSFGVLFSATWQAAVLVAITLVISAFLRRAAFRSALWTACITGLAVAPILSLSLPHCYVAYGGQVEPLHFPTLIARNLSGGSMTDRLWTLSGDNWAAHVCQVLVMVWAAGALVSSLRLAWSWVRLASLLHLAQVCRNERVQRIVDRVIPQPTSVSVLQMHGLVGAICWQIHRPKIILPAELNRLSDAELEMMIRHEWTHLKRSDPGALFVQRLVEVFYWFHPMVWLGTLQVAKYREFVCDDAVVTSGFAPLEYAQCLGQLAVWYYAPMPLAPAGLGMLWSQHLVLLRVKRLLAQSLTRVELLRPQRIALGIVASFFVLLCSLVRLDWSDIALRSHARWTAWPRWTAAALDTVGIQARDFPLDAHRYDPDIASRHTTDPKAN
jgi:bla regulator protein blaR1